MLPRPPRRLALGLALAAALVAPAAQAQRALSEKESRALTCAATMFVGASELRKAGRIDARTEDVVQTLAQDVLTELPGNRRQRTALMNERIQEVTAGKTSRQLLLDYERIEGRCRQEFFR